jgi:NAD(P)-dependent dehydrogenase (short-subunit alcohol dehydrogenase family)
MANNKVWLVTGAARGMGVDIAKAALVRAEGWNRTYAYKDKQSDETVAHGAFFS